MTLLWSSIALLSMAYLVGRHPVMATQDKPNPEAVFFDVASGKVIKEKDRYSSQKPTAIATNLEMVLEMSGEVPMESVTNSLMTLHSEIASEVGLKGDVLCKELLDRFTEYEIPIGMLEKLLMIRNYDLISFLIDDSGSMASRWQTPNKRNGATHLHGSPYGPSSTTPSYSQMDLNRYGVPSGNPNGSMESPYKKRPGKQKHPFSTRWEKAESQIYMMLDILMYLPRPEIVMTFLNSQDRIRIPSGTTPGGPQDSPELYLQRARAIVRDAFAKYQSRYSTPMLRRMTDVLSEYNGRRVLHYIFCDGEPDGGERDKEAITGLVVKRNNPENCPITFISCSPVSDQTEWMKQVDEVAPFTAEIDDFDMESEEVCLDQGTVFPYNEGVYLVCMLVAAINPYDLDALDESLPMTKYTSDRLHGVVRKIEEYRTYYDGVMRAPGFDIGSKNGVSQFLSDPAIRQQFETANCHAAYLDCVQSFLYSRDQAKGIRRTRDSYVPKLPMNHSTPSAAGPSGVQQSPIATPAYSSPDPYGGYGVGQASAPPAPWYGAPSVPGVGGAAYGGSNTSPGPAGPGYGGYGYGSPATGYLPPNSQPGYGGGYPQATNTMGPFGVYGGGSQSGGGTSSAWSQSSVAGQYAGAASSPGAGAQAYSSSPGAYQYNPAQGGYNPNSRPY